MTSYTSIQKYTPAVLAAVCKQKGMTPEEIRLGTLKRAEVELRNFLENNAIPIHLEDRSALAALRDSIRLAIGDE